MPVQFPQQSPTPQIQQEYPHMSMINRVNKIIAVSLLAAAWAWSSQVHAEAVEQTVTIEVNKPEGGECKVSAVFKGDHDNCKNDAAKGRADCSKDTGCICTRQEKHVAWKIDGKESFSIAFDQGSDNPFITKGDNECKLHSNKKGKLRCKVKGKDTPKGDYKYSITVPECPTIESHIKLY
jgi:hypothetical protein